MKAFVLMMGLLFAGSSFAAANDVIGVWKTNEGGGHVELYKNGDTLEGKIVGGEARENRETKDVNNPDPALRDRELLGLVIIKDMTYNADKDAWEKGELYRTTKGKTYKAKIRLAEDGVLKVTGYLGFFKKTVDWHKLEK